MFFPVAPGQEDHKVLWNQEQCKPFHTVDENINILPIPPQPLSLHSQSNPHHLLLDDHH